MAYVAPSRDHLQSIGAPSALRQVVFGFLLGVPAFLLLVVGMLAAYQIIHRDTIYLHIKANGVDVGGLNRAEAQARLDDYFRGYAEQPLTLTGAGQEWQVTPAELGLRTDTAGLVEEAFLIGRDGSIADRLTAPIRLRNGSTVATAPTLAPRVRDAKLAELAAGIDQSPVDARLVLNESGVAIEEARAGQRLNRELTARRMTASIEELNREPIALVVEPVPPAVTAGDLQPAAKQAQALLNAPTVLTYAGQTYSLDPATIRAALAFEGQGTETRVLLDRALLRERIQALAPAINRPAKNASLSIDGGRVRFDPGQTALTLQVGPSVEALHQALFAGAANVPLVVRETPPAVKAEQYAQARKDAAAILSGPLTVKGPTKQWALTPTDLGDLITLVEPADGEPASIVFDEEAVATLVARWAKEIDRGSISPKLDWNGGDIRVLREGRQGRELQQQKAVALVQSGALSTNRTIELPAVSWGRDVNQSNVAALGIKELVAENTTSYAGSIPSRAHNVELAAERIHGTVVAPGEQFSFNRAVGPTTIDAGFDWGYGIVNTGNGLKTVPSVAGGICQVATTLFQPVFWAGYQIDERLEHSYYIPKYASKGIPGLDTTVDEPSGLDFRFTNNSDHYLLIQSRYEDEKLHFYLFGQKPDWDVTVLEPHIRDRVKADETMVREKSDWLPAGETLWTEHAADGFTVTVTRVVEESDGATRRQSFTSYYKPARNVILVGTGQNGGRIASAPRPDAEG